VTRYSEVDQHDSQIFVHSICVNGKPRPVTTDVLAQMKEAAARDELEHNRLAWQRWEQRLVSGRAPCTNFVVPRRR
jgi:hypothetical protein